MSYDIVAGALHSVRAYVEYLTEAISIAFYFICQYFCYQLCDTRRNMLLCMKTNIEAPNVI